MLTSERRKIWVRDKVRYFEWERQQIRRAYIKAFLCFYLKIKNKKNTKVITMKFCEINTIFFIRE